MDPAPAPAVSDAVSVPVPAPAVSNAVPDAAVYDAVYDAYGVALNDALIHFSLDIAPLFESSTLVPEEILDKIKLFGFAISLVSDVSTEVSTMIGDRGMELVSYGGLDMIQTIDMAKFPKLDPVVRGYVDMARQYTERNPQLAYELFTTNLAEEITVTDEALKSIKIQSERGTLQTGLEYIQLMDDLVRSMSHNVGENFDRFTNLYISYTDELERKSFDMGTQSVEGRRHATEIGRETQTLSIEGPPARVEDTPSLEDKLNRLYLDAKKIFDESNLEKAIIETKGAHDFLITQHESDDEELQIRVGMEMTIEGLVDEKLLNLKTTILDMMAEGYSYDEVIEFLENETQYITDLMDQQIIPEESHDEIREKIYEADGEIRKQISNYSRHDTLQSFVENDL